MTNYVCIYLYLIKFISFHFLILLLCIIKRTIYIYICIHTFYKYKIYRISNENLSHFAEYRYPWSDTKDSLAYRIFGKVPGKLRIDFLEL